MTEEHPDLNFQKFYECVICDEHFESRGAINDHLQDEHGCEEDDFTHNTKQTLKIVENLIPKKPDATAKVDVPVIPVIKQVTVKLFSPLVPTKAYIKDMKMNPCSLIKALNTKILI